MPAKLPANTMKSVLVVGLVAVLFSFVSATTKPDFEAYVQKYKSHPLWAEFGESLSQKEYMTNVYFIRHFKHDTVTLGENVRTGVLPPGALDALGVQRNTPPLTVDRFKYSRRLPEFDVAQIPTPAFWNKTAFDWRTVVNFPKVKHQKRNECFAEVAAVVLDVLYQKLYPSDEAHTDFFNPDDLLKCAGHAQGETGMPDQIYSVRSLFSPSTGCHGEASAISLNPPIVFCDLWGDSNIEKKILDMLKIAPVSVGIESTNRVFRNYKSGILMPSHVQSRQAVVDHAVTVVGFGEAEEEPRLKYWTIRNSWGEGWGEGGYARIMRFSDPPDPAKGVFNAYAAVVTAAKGLGS